VSLSITEQQMSSLIVLKASVQFLSNFLTASNSNQHYVWSELIKDANSTLSNLPVTAVNGFGDDMLVANIAMLIYNASIKSPERQQSLLTSQGARTILKSLISHLRKSGADEGQSKSFYWMHVELYRILHRLQVSNPVCIQKFVDKKCPSKA
jgi:hypothetical protein